MDSLIIFTYTIVGIAPVGKGLGKTGIQLHCFVEISDSILIPAHLIIRAPPVAVSLGKIGV